MNELQPADIRSEIASADSTQHADELVTEMLNKSYALLSQAVAATQTAPMKVKDIKSYVATVEEAAKQKNVSRSIQLDAAEMSRRAEYWLEKALRDAEANGELATQGQNGGRPQKTSFNVKEVSKKPSRSDFIPQPNEASDLRKMGNATPDQFEQANREARAENNPSRANVVRKIQKIIHRDRHEPKPVAPQAALARPKPKKRTKVMQAIEVNLLDLDNTATIFQNLDVSNLDADTAEGYLLQLTEIIKTLNKFNRQLRKAVNK